MVIDIAERSIFVGTQNSTIHQFNLIQAAGSKYESIGGDPSHPLNVMDFAQTDFQAHMSEITGLDLSFDGTLLVSGDQAGDVFVWDIGTRQVLRKIKGQKGIR
jgi:pre-rRNA-processing protein IPI3